MMERGIREYRAAWLVGALSALPALFATGMAWAQPADPQMGGMGECPMMWMHRGWGIAGMILGGLLTIAAIAALVALTLFLVRRSRPQGRAGAA